METRVYDKISQVLNVFETGAKEGDYGNISIYPDGVFPNGKRGMRQITYGAKQTTEQSNLNILIKMYIDNGGLYAEQLKPYLEKIGKVSLVDDPFFIELLKKAGSDLVMQATQDEFFNEVYMKPAQKWFKDNGFTLPLSMAVIFDSFIHSGKIRDDIREMFPEVPPIKGGNEKRWIKQYVFARERWLITRRDEILRRTAYRTKTFKAAIKAENWDLRMPIFACGLEIKGIMAKMPMIDSKAFSYHH